VLWLLIGLEARRLGGRRADGRRHHRRADGKLARVLGQYSRFGAILDPAVDRLYILAALLALGVRGMVPWWVIAVLVARDLVLALTLVVLRRRGYGPYPVTYSARAPLSCSSTPSRWSCSARPGTWAAPSRAAARPGVRDLGGPRCTCTRDCCTWPSSCWRCALPPPPGAPPVADRRSVEDPRRARGGDH
jgi:hypothetical protein